MGKRSEAERKGREGRGGQGSNIKWERKREKRSAVKDKEKWELAKDIDGFLPLGWEKRILFSDFPELLVLPVTVANLHGFLFAKPNILLVANSKNPGRRRPFPSFAFLWLHRVGCLF